MTATFTSADPVGGVGFATRLADWQALFANTIFFREKLLAGRMSSAVTKNASTAFADLTGLSFAVAASEVWGFACLLAASAASATPNMRFTFTGPASPTSVMFGVLGSGVPVSAGFATTLGTAVNYTKSTTDELLVLGGCLVNGANAGTMQAQFAQSTSNASNSVIQANSFLWAWRID